MPVHGTRASASVEGFGFGASANVVPNYIENVFSTYLYTGNGSTQFIQNGINIGSSNYGGSAYFNGSTNYLSGSTSSATNFGTSNFTVECWIYISSAQSDYAGIVASASSTLNPMYIFSSGLVEAGVWGVAGVAKSTVAVNLNAWNHIALVRNSLTFTMYINGVGSNSYGAYTSAVSMGNLVIGQSPSSVYFNGYISNVRIVNGTAVYTSNFTPPTSPLTAISGTALLTLQGTTPFIDNSSNAFAITNNATANVIGPFTSSTAGSGGMVWIKDRTNSSYHDLFDTIRGAQNPLFSNSTAPQDTGETTSLISFNSNGFTVGSFSDVGASGDKYVSWTFRKQPKFFDVVTYTGTGAVQNIAHNLGSVPGCIMVKRTDNTGQWWVYHNGLNGGVNPEQYVVQLQSTSAQSSQVYWNNTAPTSTQFTVNSQTSLSGATYVAYLFAHNAGGFGLTGTDNVITCGSFTANTTVNLGYEPQWVMLKNTSATGGWYMFDNMRGMPIPASAATLFANLSGAEGTQALIAPTSTGFTTSSLPSGNTFIYIAIRRGPMAVPTDATSVFAPFTFSGSGTGTTNFPVDMVMTSNRGGASANSITVDKLRGASSTSNILYLSTASTSAEVPDTGYGISMASNTSFIMSGLWAGSASYWSFQRAPTFFDEVCYTGDGTLTRTNVVHNLTVKPEFIIIKNRSASTNWAVSALLGSSVVLNLNQNYANASNTGLPAAINGYTFCNSCTSTTLYLDSGSTNIVTAVNTNGANYVAYLFASVTGVSKIGSYTGNGTTQAISCGFTGGARFVLIKRTDSTGDWYVYDTARGMTTLTDPYLLFDSTAAETATLGSVTTTTGGFTVNASVLSAINTNAATYIFLAIA